MQLPLFIQRGLPVLACILMNGCVTPKYTVQLSNVVAAQGITLDQELPYECTLGAHRGASVDHLENTLAALQAAQDDDRYAFVEFDVQYSGDGRVVVFHDGRLLRLFRSLKVVNQTPLDELLELSEGSITTYEEAMDVVRKRLNIEIKSQGDEAEDRKLVDFIVSDIRARGREKDVLISSISSEVLKYIHQTYPQIPTGKIYWITTSTWLHLDSLTESLYRELDETGSDYLMLHESNLRNLIKLLEKKPEGKSIVFWDFDDTMYLVHKDASDQLWGSSGGSKLVSLWRRFTTVFRRD